MPLKLKKRLLALAAVNERAEEEWGGRDLCRAVQRRGALRPMENCGFGASLLRARQALASRQPGLPLHQRECGVTRRWGANMLLLLVASPTL